MRVAVIGCGSIGRRHIGNLLALGCDVLPIDASPGARARALADFPQAVASSVAAPQDAMVIATPWDVHLEYVEYAVAHRVPFFVEKPLGSLRQLPRWRELAALDLPINQVGYQCRFHPKAQALKLLFPKPDYGAVYCGVDMETWPGTYGPFPLEASHEIDMALWLGAQPTVTHATFEDRALSFDLGYWTVTLRNARGLYTRAWTVGTAEDEGATVEFHSPYALGEEMYRAELAHFLDCVRDNRQTDVPLADGVRVLEVLAQAEALCQSSV